MQQWEVSTRGEVPDRYVEVAASSAEDAARDIAHKDFPDIPRGWPPWDAKNEVLRVYSQSGQVMAYYKPRLAGDRERGLVP